MDFLIWGTFVVMIYRGWVSTTRTEQLSYIVGGVACLVIALVAS
jgi:hypothetical protein